MELFLLIMTLLLITLISLMICIEIKLEIREETDLHESLLHLRVHPFKQQLFSFQKELHFKDSNFGFLSSLLLEQCKKRQIKATVSQPEHPGQRKPFSKRRRIPTCMLVFRDLCRLMNRTLRYITVDELEWKSLTGCENAMMTALSTGFLWMLKGSILCPLSSKCRLKTVHIDVRPDYSRVAFFTTFTCILKIRIVHIIIIAGYAIVLKVRWWMNGFPAAGKVEPSH